MKVNCVLCMVNANISEKAISAMQGKKRVATMQKRDRSWSFEEKSSAKMF